MNQKITIACLIGFALFTPSCLQARLWSESTAGTLEGMSYRYFLPKDYDATNEYPLVLFLHGSGESGTRNINQVRLHISGLIDKTESDFPAILVAPQLPLAIGWGPNQTIDKTDDLLQMLIQDLAVNTNRLYLTGLSMGGFGSMEYLQHYNGEENGDIRFAAVAPLSGASVSTSREGVPENLEQTPVWLAHGGQDNVVSASSSRNTFSVLAGLDSSNDISFTENLLGGPTAIVGNKRYTEITNGSHGIWSPIYTNDEFYDWMFAQSLAVPEPSTLMMTCFSVILFLRKR